jgi:hypothetical protein
LDGHRLALEAAEQRDGDLLRALIFDRLPEWTNAQVQLAQQGLFLDRYPLGLYLFGSDPLEPADVEVNPDLRQALVTMTSRYRVGDDVAGADVVQLRQVFAYQYQDDRWLLNPPTGAYWGPIEMTSGRYLTLRFPERDADLSQRLAADLEATISQACNAIEGMNCQGGSRIEVDLVTDPAVLLELLDPAWFLSADPAVDLPAPTLLGLPVDAAGYRVLYRAYAQQIVLRLIAQQTGLTGSDQTLLGLAISELILQRLGLRGGAATPAGVADSGRAVTGRLESLWNNGEPAQDRLTDGDLEFARALASFLAREWSDLPETEMLRLLALSGSEQEWLSRLNPASAEADLIVEWQHFWDGAQRPAPQDWPDEVVLLMCDQGIVGSSSVYRYDPAEEILSRVLSNREFIRMEALPGGEGVLLTEQLIRQDGLRMYLWREGRLEALERDADSQLGFDGSTARPRSAQASPLRQNQVRAVSNDGRWQAELGEGTLIITATGDEIRKVVPHGARDCRAVAWVQSTGDVPRE